MSTLISVVTGCYNEADNVEALYLAVKAQFAALPEYRYEHIFIDNASSDATLAKLKAIASQDANVKIIVNTRNFGHIRSPYHALLQARGAAVISLVADLQDPPEYIPHFLSQWQAGFKVVVGVKATVAEGRWMAAFRRACYQVFAKLTPIPQIKHFTGFGLYDQRVIELLRQFADPYPYFRGQIADMGFEVCEIPYHQPLRQHGVTKNNWYTLYDMAMAGLTQYAKAPMRVAVFLGLGLSVLSLIATLVLIAIKLWAGATVALGSAAIVVAIIFASAVQLVFIGVLGEYIAAVQTQVQRRPLVIEKQRINFD